MAEAQWNFDEGTELMPGRGVVELVRAGKRYEVYLVWDERLYAFAIAKVLKPDRLNNDAAQRRFLAEAELLERLAHPVIVRALDVRSDVAHPHILLEYVEAPNLRRLVKSHGPLPIEQLLPLGVQVASALHYLSVEGVVHLDVKPSNVLMAAQPRLIDLGGARTLSEAARLSRAVGTASFRAPEQSDPAAANGVGPAADVWGLGATLYYAASGAAPQPSAPEPPARVPVPLQELILAMLAAEPANRPTAAEAADGLADLIG